MKKERKLPLTAMLNAIDHHDVNWLARQSDEARKEFAPLVAMRWAACAQHGVKAERMLWRVNQRVNRYLFAPTMSQHDDLMFRLLASCGRNDTLQRTWIKSSNHGANPLIDLLAEHHPTATNAELQMLLSLHRREDIATLAEDCGRSKNEVKDYLKAYDKLIR